MWSRYSFPFSFKLNKWMSHCMVIVSLPFQISFRIVGKQKTWKPLPVFVFLWEGVENLYCHCNPVKILSSNNQKCNAMEQCTSEQLGTHSVPVCSLVYRHVPMCFFTKLNSITDVKLDLQICFILSKGASHWKNSNG